MMTANRFAALACALWLAAGALTFYIATISGIPAVDLALAQPAHDLAVANPWLVWVARFFAAMGSGFVLAPLTVGVVVALWLRGQRWWAVWLAADGITGIVVSQTVKRVVDRQRPAWDNPLVSWYVHNIARFVQAQYGYRMEACAYHSGALYYLFQKSSQPVGPVEILKVTK